MIWDVLSKPSSNSPSVQVLHQQIRRGAGRGVKTCADLADTGRWGVQNLGKPADVILECSLKSTALPVILTSLVFAGIGIPCTWDKSYRRDHCIISTLNSVL